MARSERNDKGEAKNRIYAVLSIAGKSKKKSRKACQGMNWVASYLKLKVPKGKIKVKDKARAEALAVVKIVYRVEINPQAKAVEVLARPGKKARARIFAVPNIEEKSSVKLPKAFQGMSWEDSCPKTKAIKKTNKANYNEGLKAANIHLAKDNLAPINSLGESDLNSTAIRLNKTMTKITMRRKKAAREVVDHQVVADANLRVARTLEAQ